MKDYFCCRGTALLLLFIFVMLITCTAVAADSKDRIGIVLLHGKTGRPERVGAGVVGPLSSEGYLIEVPEMPWSKDRYIDKTYEEALAEIDAAVASLKSKGATKIVIAGHSMGAAATIVYAAHRHDLAGVVLFAPGHATDFPAFRSLFAADVAKAKALVDAGKGNEVTVFNDTNKGTYYTIKIKPTIYYSFFSPDGLGAVSKAAETISPDIPVLLIAGSHDPLTKGYDQGILTKLPANSLSRYSVVNADHLDVPAAGVNEMIKWLNELP